MTRPLWAASKYRLQIRNVAHPDKPSHYTYALTRDGAVQSLIDREVAAIEEMERQLKRRKARLAAFIKREGNR